MTINKALPGGNPSIVHSFNSVRKRRKTKRKEEKKKKKRKEKSVLVCFAFVFLFQVFGVNTMKFESTNNQHVDSTNPDPRLLRKGGR